MEGVVYSVKCHGGANNWEESRLPYGFDHLEGGSYQ